MGKSAVLLLVLVLVFASSTVSVQFALSSVGEAENSWVTKAPMHEARNSLGVVAVNGKIYAIGGNTWGGFWFYSMGLADRISGEIVGTNEEYDPATDTWSFKTPMPTPRTSFAITAYNGKIYCIGGANSPANEVYDPATDTWETKTPPPANVSVSSANVINGKIYGIDHNGANYVYNPETDSWETRTPTPKPSAAGFNGHVSAVLAGKLHIIGGLSSNQDSNLHQIYNPATDSWTYGSVPPNSINGAFVDGAATATTGELALRRLYVFGLQGALRQGEPQGSNRIYDPQTDSWTFGANLPTERINFGVAVVNDTFYVVGGGSADNWFVGNFAPSAVNEQYVPIGYGAPDPSYVLEHTPPRISLLSPLNQTYTESNVTLTFFVDKLVNWVGYSLDGQETVTVIGNTTLSGLSNGLHNVTAYAEDEFENSGTSETVYFSVDVPEPFPTIIVGAASAIAAVIMATVLLVYFKKRQHQS